MSPPMRQAWRYCLSVFIAMRVSIAVLGVIATGALPQRGPVDVPGWPDHTYTPGAQNLVTSLEHQDALWFLRIADDGYRTDDASSAFFPGYPLSVRAISALLGGRPLAAGLLVSNVAFLLALVLLYDLTRRERSDEAARRTVLYLCIFPTAFFLVAPYSESLFLLLAVATFRQARLRRWPSAGIAGIAAAATRSLGVVLAPALAVEALHQRREDRAAGVRAKILVPLICSAAVILGLVAYLAFWRAASGDALAPLHIQSSWLRAPMFPLESLIRGIAMAGSNAYLLLDALIVVPVVALAVMLPWRARPSYTVYVWLGILIPLSMVWGDRPLMSMPRFALLLFPVFWVLADLTIKRRIPHTLVIAVSSAGLALLTVLFVNNYFVF